MAIPNNIQMAVTAGAWPQALRPNSRIIQMERLATFELVEAGCGWEASETHSGAAERLIQQPKTVTDDHSAVIAARDVKAPLAEPKCWICEVRIGAIATGRARWNSTDGIDTVARAHHVRTIVFWGYMEEHGG
ncbi:hypothetical protein KIH07_01900 [Hydrogenophaga taeniospiralis]|uniref:hypothetical protein n=1 Tax=Hydrogenophaga taeniospiralis TaxID=65656 RepID=UPI001CFB72F8|nr:hypothetical protein [Hydrogenophaga taeniospiralis]MCB4362467.1 hypothetical protein [Hydrogenophaga taeniospiralis]